MVRIRMKSFGRRHRPFFRICAMDARAPRDGRVKSVAARVGDSVSPGVVLVELE